MSLKNAQDPTHDSAISHVLGTSEFIDDHAALSDELIIGVYASPIAKGILKKLDVSPALLIPGVKGVYTYKDLQENLWGPIKADQPILIEKEISYLGQPICVVAAENLSSLNLALRAIKSDLVEIKPRIHLADAIKSGDFFEKPIHLGQKDVSDIIKASDHMLEGDFYSKGQDHFYLESQACLAIPKDGRFLEILSSSQHPTEIQHGVAHALGLRFHDVVSIVKRMGGAFGGKESQSTHYAILCALAALKSQKPCRLILSKDEDMIATGKRHPFYTKWRVGFSKTGIINALEAKLFSDGGAFLDLSTPIMQRALFHTDNAYFIAHSNLRGQICRTNLAPNTAFRGFGGPQGVMVIENIIEDMAHFLKVDSLDVRLANLYGASPRNKTPYGQIVKNQSISELVLKLKETSNYQSRLESIKNNATALYKKGRIQSIALTPVKFGISFTLKMLNQASAIVNVHIDGTIQVSTGATEMGQGVNSKIATIVARAFGIDQNSVRVMTTSTEKNHNTSATAASSGTDLNGSAAWDACTQIKKRMTDFLSWYQSFQPNDLPNPFAGHGDYEESSAQPSHIDEFNFENGFVIAKSQPNSVMEFSRLAELCYQFRVSLGANGFYKTKGIHFDWQKGTGTPFLYFTTGAAVSEVEIDCLTGETKVLATDILMDLGRPINSAIDRGQVIGGYIQGLGWVTSEDLQYSEAGNLLSHSPTTYKIPNIQDIPRRLVVDFRESLGEPENIMGSKAVGEPPFLLCASVFAAIRKGILATHPHKNIKLSLPATPEAILTALGSFSG